MRLALILAVLLGAPSAIAAVGVRSERFQVVGDVDEATAGRAAAHLEATATRLADLGFRIQRPELPVSVFVFANGADLEPYRDQARGRAFAASSEDRLFIVIDWSAAGDRWLALSHEYAHLATDMGRMQPWFREGLADFLALQRGHGLTPVSASDEAMALRSQSWLPISEWLDARDGTDAYGHPLFYAQSWLGVSWLASQHEGPLSQLDSQPLYDKLAIEGPAAVELQLRAYAAQLQLGPRVPMASITTTSGTEAHALSEQEWEAWRLELLRGIHGNSAAEPQLRALISRWEESPLTRAALGALAIERGGFDEAEVHLQIAASAPQATALTHHRYALMLLRPSPESRAIRAQEAALHASQALDIVPGSPEFLRTLAHAETASGEWDRAAKLLLDLQSRPGWAEPARRDFEELERSRWQSMRQTAGPVILPAESAAPLALAQAPLAPLTEPRDYPWPPPDTQIMIGKIARVDCSSGEKLIVMQHPLFRIQFVELAKQPAKLHHPPLKWKTIPCGTYGWNVNIAYVPYRNQGALKGEARAILF